MRQVIEVGSLNLRAGGRSGFRDDQARAYFVRDLRGDFGGES
jgi:hypothetical protein